jgi:hypothetical protein
MGVWDQGQSAAAPRIADLAKRLALPPYSTEQSYIIAMRTGADMVLHELQMEFINSGQKSISIKALSIRFEKLRRTLDALTPPEGR